MPGFLIDLDGTLYNGNDAIPAARRFISLLRQHKLPFLLLTNNSSRTPQDIAKHLLNVCGIEVLANEIFSSAMATARYVADQDRQSLVYFIGENGLEHALMEAGLNIISGCNQTNAHFDEKLHKLGLPKFVVQGIDRKFSYALLQQAMYFISAGAISINTNPDLHLPTENGWAPGSGSIAAAIKAASGVEPIVIGKPMPIIMNYAIEMIGLPANNIWVIGDNLRTDIRGGKDANCQTALVLTGLATAENVQQQIADSGVKPDLICADLNEFISRIIALP